MSFTRENSEEHTPRCQNRLRIIAVFQILFLGDSTLRGMMYEAVQQLNGSLARWEKSHDVAVYNQTNKGNTIFAFAYYPKFWRRKLPSFELTLKKLIDR